MYLHGTSKVNAQGHLEIGGCDVTELAKEYGTPLYIVDEALVRKRANEYVTAFQKFWPAISGGLCKQSIQHNGNVCACRAGKPVA